MAAIAAAMMPAACGSPARTTDTEAPTRDQTAPTVAARFVPPDGFLRAPVQEGSFAEYLRYLPLRTDRGYVRSYRGVRLSSPAAAVAELDVGTRDVQQCADSLIRLHAEWLWTRGRADEAVYHFTSGHESSWRRWRDGERFRVAGRRVSRVQSGEVDGSYDSFKRYLFHTFRYASTRSMHRDSRRIPITSVQAGDFLLQPGSPGHTVMILDVVKHPDGRIAVLLGQGAMPAQEFHVIEHRHQRVLDGVWFVLPRSDRGTIETPSWKPFSARELRRFATL